MCARVPSGANGATFSGQTCTRGAPDGETVNGGVRTCRECYAEFGMEEANGCVIYSVIG